MKMVVKWAVMAMSIWISVCSVPAYGKFSIQFQNQIFQYSSLPRLSIVLEPVANKQHWYWPAASIFRQDAEVKAQKKAFISEIHDLVNSETDSVTHHALIAMAGEIKTWRVDQRLNVVVDYDLARFNEKFNPRVEPGKYILQLVQRPKFILAIGAIDSPAKLPLTSPSKTLSYYANLTRLDQADKNYVYVVQPNGKVLHIGVAYWNRQNTEIMPGSIIIVPWAKNSDRQLVGLNKKLVMLAKQKVL